MAYAPADSASACSRLTPYPCKSSDLSMLFKFLKIVEIEYIDGKTGLYCQCSVVDGYLVGIFILILWEEETIFFLCHSMNKI